MRELFYTLSIIISSGQLWAQSISPGGLYAASASGSANGVSVNWVLGNLNSFSQLSPLPVRLISFEGKLTASGLAELRWKTAEEINNIGFEIQKSTDGRSWDLLAWVEGAVNTKTEHSYRYTDIDFTTTSYYRLRQVNTDDSYTYSRIVCMIPEKESLDRFYVYPNPSRESKISVQLPEKTQRLILFDQLGRNLGQIEAPPSERTVTLPNTGSFLIQIDTPVGSKSIKVIYQ